MQLQQSFARLYNCLFSVAPKRVATECTTDCRRMHCHWCACFEAVAPVTGPIARDGVLGPAVTAIKLVDVPELG